MRIQHLLSVACAALAFNFTQSGFGLLARWRRPPALLPVR